MSPDGRHINFTSKDREQVLTFKKCLGIDNEIGRKARGAGQEKKYYVLQFGDILFYQFLISIGVTAKKSKIIGAVKIPDEYFFDFLRGHLDGDGTFYSYWDPRWRSSFMFYTEFISASKWHILWIREEIVKRCHIKGHITKSVNNSCYQLKYAKADSLKILSKLYRNKDVICLSRKRLKIEKALAIIGEKL